MNLLKKYKETLEATVVMGCLPAMMVAVYALDLCKHC
jgi:hypothetical protein